MKKPTKLHPCYICRTSKEEEYFYKDITRKSGFCTRCKSCTSNVNNNPETYKKRYKKDRKYFVDYQRKYKKDNPLKVRAREIVAKALKEGKLERGNCKVCNKPKAQAHHPDYSKSLKVIWLCSIHHQQLHHKLQIKNISK